MGQKRQSHERHRLGFAVRELEQLPVEFELEQWLPRRL
jgi:hypothetical protein